MQPQRIGMERVSVASLKPDLRNARQHTKKQIKQIAESIRQFGFNVPVLIDKSNCVIAGHGRLQAAAQLGLDELPIIRLEHLSQAQARAFAIAENRLNELSSWDEGLLGQAFLELSAQDLDFELETTGFSTTEIDMLVEAAATDREDSDADDNVPEPPSEVAISKPGDLWLLGPHKVLCGNALEAPFYAALLGKDRAHFAFTDVPYNVPIAGHASGQGAVQHRDFAMASGEMSDGAFTGFLTTACAHLAQHTVDGAIHYVCIDWRHVDALLAAGKIAYAELKNICVWVKNNAGMGSLYRSQHEFVLVFKSGKGAHRNNIELGRHGRNRTNVWNYPGATTFSRTSDEGYLLGLHPTVKPVRMVADAILDTSRRGDIVLDAFGGSGTTVIAAERTGRRAYLIEIDPLYTDTIVRRWQNYTGDQARHGVTGITFAEHEEVVRHEQR